MLAILQFDAASVSLVGRMLAAGRLPVLAGLVERGRWLELDGPATHFAAGAFPTLYTGAEIAEHGLFYPFQWSAPEQRVRYTTAFDAPAPIWERVSGVRCLVIDPYESRPPRRPPAGTLVSGWQLSDRVVLQRWSSPTGTHRRLTRLFGPPGAVEEVFGRHSADELLGLRRRLLAASDRVTQAATLLLGREAFDLVWLTFGAAHVAGHQFWDLSQVARGGVDADVRHVLSTALEEVYATVDAGLGEVLAALPGDADVMVVSPVGMDVNTSRADLLPEMLAAVLAGGVGDHGATTRSSDRAGAVWRLRAAVPADLRAKVAAALPDTLALALTARLETPSHDWSTTRAFAHPADNQGYVRLNLRGRERDGIVDPAGAAGVMDEIAAGLASFHDLDGEPAVAGVDRVASTVGPGRYGDRLPDLVVRFSDRPSTGLQGVRSDRFGLVRRHGAASGRSGNHTPGDAWALVVPGTSAHREPSRPARLVDVAATVAALGEDPVDGLAGEPLLTRG
ncbi:MAG: alkaline phosphatase family protein [Egibacteraceae bacterium]